MNQSVQKLDAIINALKDGDESLFIEEYNDYAKGLSTEFRLELIKLWEADDIAGIISKLESYRTTLTADRQLTIDDIEHIFASISLLNN